jgi:aminoglycoside phosphotransferase family enzyme/predicted kinase
VTSLEQPTLVRDLLLPRAYPPPPPAAITLKSTHASWVFLADDDVWKIKRPVNLGFLDFRLPEARRAFCEEEVRLNRRLAPDVYLGVEPVREGAAGHVIGGQEGLGPVVDWAVHMRRLEDGAGAGVLLDRGELGPDRLSALAIRLTAFFEAARVTPAFGLPNVLGDNLVENFEQTRPFVGDLIDEDAFEQARAFQERELRAGADRFSTRVREGRCREGHGDLRLEHIYFVPDGGGRERPVVIDCVEFSERYRSGDVAGEVAFLAMELEAARRPDLAAIFVARFAEASDDFGLYGVLDFYLSYRAWVRGKVAALLSADPGADRIVRQGKRQEARRLFGLARAFSGVGLDRPFVVAVGGMIGAGKSTLAASLGDELAVPVVSSDRTRKFLAGLGLTDLGAADLYTPERIEATYDEVLRRAGEVVAAGRGVIVDASFRARRHRAAAAALAARAGAPFAFVEARCSDEETLRRRLRAREGTRAASDAREELLPRFREGYEPVRPGEAGTHVPVETRGEPVSSVAAALAGLRAAGIVPARERCFS